MPVIHLRASTPDDAPFIYGVFESTLRRYLEAASRKWSVRRMTAKCEQDAASPHTRIVQVDGQDCGVLTVEERADCLWLESMLLLDAFQRRAVGTRLLADILARADALGLPVRLWVMPGNPARAFYERAGFARTDETAEYVAMERPAPDRGA